MDEQNKLKIAAIILAAGRGTRMKSNGSNKVAMSFHGKPIVEYGVELMESVAEKVVVVVGAYADSVKDALKNHPKVEYAYQLEQLGTGHATQVGFEPLKAFRPDVILFGYGDHMMFYKVDRIKELIELHQKQQASISLITTHFKDPDSLAWARVMRDSHNNIAGLVEQKDATDEQKKITEINPGFYCFSFDFLEKFLGKIQKSTVTNEFYITDLFHIAFDQDMKITALPVPFEEVGIGINKHEELEKSQKLYSDLKQN